MEDYHQFIANAVKIKAEQLGRLVDYVEVGVLTGNSAEAVLETNKVRFAVLIDQFPEDYHGFHSSKEQVSKRLQPYAGLFDIREGDSREILPAATEEFDVGFVDGDHSPEGCLSDMTNMLRVLRNDGVMFVDDLSDTKGCHLDGVARKFAEANNLSFTYHNVHNGLGELRRK